MKDILRSELSECFIISLSVDFEPRPVAVENSLLDSVSRAIRESCSEVPGIGVHSRRKSFISYDTGDMELTGLLEETVYSFGATSKAFVPAEEYERIPSNIVGRGKLWASATPGELSLQSPLGDAMISVNGLIPSRLAVDLALSQTEIFLSPMKALRSREMVLLSVLLLCPRIWSSKRFIEDYSFIETYRRISEALEIERAYMDFINSIIFLKNTRSSFWVVEALRCLSMLSMLPPYLPWNALFTIIPPLGRNESRLMEALLVKEAADHFNLSPSVISYVLVSNVHIGDGKKEVRNWLRRSISRREPPLGLTKSELSRLLRMDRNTVDRSLLSLMNLGLVYAGVTRSYRNRGRPPAFYRVNAGCPFVRTLLDNEIALMAFKLSSHGSGTRTRRLVTHR